MKITGLGSNKVVTRWGMTLTSYWHYTVEWQNTTEYRVVAWQVSQPDYTVGGVKVGACCNAITVEHLEDGGVEGIAADVRQAIQCAVASRLERVCICVSFHFQPNRVGSPHAKAAVHG